jgi:hypothetical protein
LVVVIIFIIGTALPPTRRPPCNIVARAAHEDVDVGALRIVCIVESNTNKQRTVRYRDVNKQTRDVT